MGFVYLAVAIVAEVIATASLKASDQFSKPWYFRVMDMISSLRRYI